MIDKNEIKFRCKICDQVFSELGELELHADQEHGDQPLDFEILTGKVEEKLSIVEGEEDENELLEEEAETEEELRGRVVLENYENIEDQSLKKMVLSKAIGQSVGSDKDFHKPISTRDVEQGAYLRDMLCQIESGQCPVCKLHWSQINTNLSGSSQEELKAGFILQHLSEVHPKVYELLKELFPVPWKTEIGIQHVESPNPESCSDPEELSREEIIAELNANPEVRRQFYLKAFKKLSQRD